VSVCARISERFGFLRVGPPFSLARVPLQSKAKSCWRPVYGPGRTRSLRRRMSRPAHERTLDWEARESSRGLLLSGSGFLVLAFWFWLSGSGYWPPPDHRSCCSKNCFASVAARAAAVTPASTDRAMRVDTIVFMASFVLFVFRHRTCRQDRKRRNWPEPLGISRTCERT